MKSALLLMFIYRIPPNQSLSFSSSCNCSRRKASAVFSSSEAEPEYRSISDYVGGLHGGKYEFDDRILGVTALNYEKSVVFGNTIREDPTRTLAPLDDEESRTIPKWARRPVDLSMPIGIVDESGNSLVRIVNEEISWEPFYATLEDASGNPAVEKIGVSPSAGKLAPRGGCDVYSDECIISLDLESSGKRSPTGEKLSSGQPLFLVVRTELDSWVWQVNTQC